MKRTRPKQNVDPRIKAISFCAKCMTGMAGGLARFASDFFGTIMYVPDYGDLKRPPR